MALAVVAVVTLIASQPGLSAVHASAPANSARELVALAKAQPGKFSCASAGTGSATHLGSPPVELERVLVAEFTKRAKVIRAARMRAE